MLTAATAGQCTVPCCYLFSPCASDTRKEKCMEHCLGHRLPRHNSESAVTMADQSEQWKEVS